MPISAEYFQSSEVCVVTFNRALEPGFLLGSNWTLRADGKNRNVTAVEATGSVCQIATTPGSTNMDNLVDYTAVTPDVLCLVTAVPADPFADQAVTVSP